MAIPRCGACRHWRPHPGNLVGTCMYGDLLPGHRFTTDADEDASWCDAHSPRAETQESEAA